MKRAERAIDAAIGETYAALLAATPEQLATLNRVIASTGLSADEALSALAAVGLAPEEEP